jgi:polypeptide N-acetylgalactosaminyltransferase
MPNIAKFFWKKNYGDIGPPKEALLLYKHVLLCNYHSAKDAVTNDPKMIACPIIDEINAEKFDLRKGKLSTGGFNWAFNFKWDFISYDMQRNWNQGSYVHEKNIILTPAIAGGLFTIRKDWFHQLGEFDDQMQIWGGENIEISLRLVTKIY